MNNRTKALFSLAVTGASFVAVDAVVCEKTIKVTKYKYDAHLSDDKISLCVLSDLHYSKFGRNNEYLVKKCAGVSPDLILIVGDFFDCHNNTSNENIVCETLKALTKIAPVYFSPGNHDKRFNAKTGKNYEDYVLKSGCTLLDGSYVDLCIKNKEIRLGGMFDYDVFEEDYGDRWAFSPMNKFLKNFENTDRLKILLAHRPNTFMYTKNEKRNTDIIFSGHVHGGVWKIPVLNRGLYAPEQGFLPKYDRGEFDFNSSKMYLCSGLEGFYEIPRLLQRAEIMNIEIV